MSQYTVHGKENKKAWHDATASWNTYRKQVKNKSLKNPLDDLNISNQNN